jgi:hypothetical protein
MNIIRDEDAVGFNGRPDPIRLIRNSTDPKLF